MRVATRLLQCAVLAVVFSSPAFADRIRDSVLSSKKLRIACDPLAAPLNFNKPDGTFEGFEVDLANVIAKSIDPSVKVEWVPVKWDQIPQTVNSEKVHLGLNGLFITANKKEGDWGVYTEPYFKTGIAIAYHAGIKAVSFADLKKSKAEVGALNDPQSIGSLKKNDLKVRTYDDASESFLAFEENKIGFLAYELPILRHYVSKSMGKFRIVEGIVPGSENKYAGLVKKEAVDLLADINGAIKKWRAGPQAKAVLQKLESL